MTMRLKQGGGGDQADYLSTKPLTRTVSPCWGCCHIDQA